MLKTVETLELICSVLVRECQAKCYTKHVHGELLGTSAVAIAPIEFPDGSRYLIQITKLSRCNDKSG